jgi:hypothetical protein
MDAGNICDRKIDLCAIMIFSTQNVVTVQETWASCGSLLQIQNLWPRCRPPDSRSAFYQDARGLVSTLEFDNK